MSWEDRNLTGLENLALLQFCADNNCTPADIEEVSVEFDISGALRSTITLKKKAEMITIEGNILL